MKVNRKQGLEPEGCENTRLPDSEWRYAAGILRAHLQICPWPLSYRSGEALNGP